MSLHQSGHVHNACNYQTGVIHEYNNQKSPTERKTQMKTQNYSNPLFFADHRLPILLPMAFVVFDNRTSTVTVVILLNTPLPLSNKSVTASTNKPPVPTSSCGTTPIHDERRFPDMGSIDYTSFKPKEDPCCKNRDGWHIGWWWWTFIWW